MAPQVQVTFTLFTISNILCRHKCCKLQQREYSIAMTLNLDTIILYVRDVNRLKSFYTDLLHLAVIEEIEAQWVLLQAGTGSIGLHRMGDAYLESTAEVAQDHSNTKIVFATGEDIQRLRQQLLDQGVRMREIKTFDNYDYWLCDGEDPEGNVFQLKQKKTVPQI